MQNSSAALAVQVRRMGIAFAVAVRMMPPMDGCPENYRPLRGHGAENNQGSPQERDSLKRTMGDQTMESHSNSEHSRCVHDREYRKVDRINAAVPEQYDPRRKANIRNKDCRQGNAPFDSARSLVQRMDSTRRSAP